MFLSCTPERHFLSLVFRKMTTSSAIMTKQDILILDEHIVSLTCSLWEFVTYHVRRGIHMAESVGDQITSHSFPPTNVLLQVSNMREKKSINHSYLSHTLWTTRISWICGCISFFICLHIYVFLESKYHWQWR